MYIIYIILIIATDVNESLRFDWSETPSNFGEINRLRLWFRK